MAFRTYRRSADSIMTMTNVRPDILIFLSDQHNGRVVGYAGDPWVETPNLDALARDGTVFSHAYTPCPLCVPARVAMLSGQLPARTAAFTNSAAIPEDHATFLHGLVAAGYETVLCGRMHFIGEDQRHGFTRRIFPDFTPQFWQSGRRFNDDLGPYAGTLDANAQTLRAKGGGGCSPVLAYDQAVVDAAVAFLAHDHAKPLCLVVGTYGPHNPYVCAEELYRKYRRKVGLPRQFGPPLVCDNLFTRNRRVEMTAGEVLSLRAAYYGMVETIDRQVGQVRTAWRNRLLRRAQPQSGIFIYTSDHGDHIGERNILAKQTMFEPSVRIPLVFQGADIPAGRVLDGPVSLLDLGPTLAALTGAPLPPAQDGLALWADIQSAKQGLDRAVLADFMERADAQPVLCRMVVQGSTKLVTYSDRRHEDLLFDLASDPAEQINLAAQRPESLQHLRNLAWNGLDVNDVLRRDAEKLAHAKVLVACGDALGPPETEVWTAMRGQYRLPEVDDSQPAI